MKRLEKYFPRDMILKLTSTQKKILAIIETFSQISAKQIFYQSGYSDERGVKRTLNSLTKLRSIKRIGISKSDPNAYYELNKKYLRGDSRGTTISPEQLELFKL